MKTEFVNIDFIPSKEELLLLLGEEIYEHHNILCEKISSLLNPDVEIWDSAGRRGKYLHGFRIDSKSILIDLYLFSSVKKGYLKCEFTFQKRSIEKVLENIESLSNENQQRFLLSLESKNKYGGFYFDINVNKQNMLDSISIIEMVSGGFRNLR